MARIRQSDEPTRKDGYDSMNEYLKPAAAQSDAPSAAHSAEAFFRENGMECVPERTLVICERYAALRTAQLEGEIYRGNLHIEAIEIQKSNLLTRAETAESALVDAKKLIAESVSFLEILNVRGRLGLDVHNRIEQLLTVAAEPPKKEK